MLTKDELRRLLGDRSDATFMRILELDPTEAEVIEALQWLQADDALGTELERGRRSVVGRIYEILLETEAPYEEP